MYAAYASKWCIGNPSTIKIIQTLIYIYMCACVNPLQKGILLSFVMLINIILRFSDGLITFSTHIYALVDRDDAMYIYIKDLVNHVHKDIDGNGTGICT